MNWQTVTMSDIGALGELKAMDLLCNRLRMEVYVPLADKEVDLIALRQDRCYRIQVKTSMFQRNSYFWFDLHKNRMACSEDTLYICV